MPIILNCPQDMISKSQNYLQSGKSIGFVPTMGALHQGHISLLDAARKENDIVILSIFVNPTQFNDKNDLENYPKTWAQDLEIAQKCGVDIIFSPNYDEIYPDNYAYMIEEKKFSHELCGKDRIGHFDGVLTIVMKLFNITKANRAYFGEKDFQQLLLIEGMVKAFFLDIEIKRVPIIRADDGLALSSRNMRLNKRGRTLAPNIYKIILSANSADDARQKLMQIGFDVDYVVDTNNRRYAAVKTNETDNGQFIRLIDNVEI